jgi:hypothetical protein
MARYNTAPQTLIVPGATTFTYAFTGGIISLTGTAGYTVTLVSPVFFPGSRQTFYNATSGDITLATAAGTIRGNGITIGPSVVIPTNSTYVLTSDGTDYVLTSALAGTTVFELPVTTRSTFTAEGVVNLTPANANVTISPTGSGTVAISPAGLVSIQPGGNVTISPTGTSTLTLNTAGGALTIGSASVPAVIGGNLTATTANAAITLSPTGASGTVTISPGDNVTISAGDTLAISSSVTGSMNNVTIGNVTRAGGNFTTLSATNAVTLTANTTSTSTTSGTLVVTGGLGVSGAIYAGSLQSTPIGATTRSTGAFTTLTSNAATTFTQNTASTSTVTGTLVVSGGVGVSGAIYAGSLQNTPIGSATRNSGAFTTLTANSSTTITATTASSSTATGALVVSGGVGIAGALYAGSIQNTAIGATTANTGRFTTLTTTGAVTLSPASAAVAISPTGTGTVVISPAGALTIGPSTLGTINNMSIGASTRSTGAFTTLTANGITTITNTTASTNVNSGALQVDGGVGINGAIYAGSIQNTPIGSTTRQTGAFTTLTSNGITTFTGNSASTSTTTGTLRVTGGVGVSGAIFAGSITSVGVLTSQGGTAGIIGYTNQTATATLADIDRKYIVSNTAAITLTLPNTSTDGRTIVLADGNNFGSFNVTVGRGTRNIGGLAENLILNVPGSYVELVYRGGDWKVFTF